MTYIKKAISLKRRKFFFSEKKIAKLIFPAGFIFPIPCIWIFVFLPVAFQLAIIINKLIG
jgi:hypothetical protein